MKRTSILTALSFLLLSCGGGSGPSSTPISPATNVTITGTVEKGPFNAGAIIAVTVLDALGGNTGETLFTTVGANLGNFSFIAEPNQILLVSAQGRFRDEITGRLSTEEISLQALFSVSAQARQNANINLLTHLTSARALELVRSENATIPQAKDQAEIEFLSAFSSVVNNPVEFSFSDLTIFGSTQTNGSPYLLLLSSLFYQQALNKSDENLSRPEIELSTLLDQMQSDFSVDGAFDNTMQMEELRSTLTTLDPDLINRTLRDLLLGRVGITIPDINTLLDSDLDGLVNSIDTDDDNDSIPDAEDINPFDFNDPPSISGTPPTDILAFQEFIFVPSSSDMDGDNLTFTIQNKPSWLNFNESNGALTGTPTNEDTGIYSDITITVTDGYNLERLGTFSIQVLINPWIPLSNMPIDSYDASAAGSNTHIYLTGGSSVGNEFNQDSFLIYDIAADSWRSKPAMPTRRVNHTSHLIGSELFTLGGIPGVEVDPNTPLSDPSVEAFNIATEVWSEKSPMNIPRVFATSCVVNEKIYVFGGRTFDVINGFTTTDTVEMYDPLTDTWTNKMPMGQPRSALKCVVLNDLIYIFGGTSESGNSFEIYNPAIDDWVEGGELPISKIIGFSVGAIEEKIYLIGGAGSGILSATENTVHVYDPILDVWTPDVFLLMPRIFMASTVVDNQFYVFGGHSRNIVDGYILSTDYLNSAIVFRPPM